MMMDMIREDLASLDIRHDVFFSERSLSTGPVDHIRETIEDLRARVSSTRAGLRRPRASRTEDWEDREQTLFRATAFGDDVDRPLLKSDGLIHVFRLRYRLPRVESSRAASRDDRRVGRGPRRLCEAHEARRCRP